MTDLLRIGSHRRAESAARDVPNCRHRTSGARERQRTKMDLDFSEVPQSTLALVVLKALESIGPLHRRAVARRVEQLSGTGVQLNEGTVYAVLMRLKQKGWIASHQSAF